MGRVAETAKMVAELDLKTGKFTKGTKDAIGSLGKLTAATAKSRAVAVGLGVGLEKAAVAGARAIGDFVGDGLQSLADLETATVSVDGAIKQMGLTGKLTSAQIATWANQIESDIGAAFDDKEITAAATTLLRFGKVTPENLQPALQVMTDLATKTGSIESAATLLAKAFVDPADAAGKLKRSGVVLNDQQKKELVTLTTLTKEEQKHFIKLWKADKQAAARYKTQTLAGKQTKAQAFLIKELAKVTTGAAAASQGPYARSLSILKDVTEDAQRALATGLLPVIEKVRDMLSKELAKPETLERIKGFGRDLATGFSSLVDFITKLPWDTIKNALGTARDAAKGIVDAFLGLPTWVQTAVITGWGLNKLSGGLVGDLVSELGKGLIRGVLGITAAVVHINAASVTGGGGGLPNVLPGAAGGAAAAAGGLTLTAAAALIAAPVAIAATGIVLARLNDPQGTKELTGRAATATARGIPDANNKPLQALRQIQAATGSTLPNHIKDLSRTVLQGASSTTRAVKDKDLDVTVNTKVNNSLYINGRLFGAAIDATQTSVGAGIVPKMIVTIAGAAYTFRPNSDELSRIGLEFAAFDGEVGNGTFPLPDPAGGILPVTGRQFKVEQDSTLLTDGFIQYWDRQRGPFRTGPGREYGISVQDANALLGGFLATITRPSETDYARVIAFATQYRPTWDTTWVLNTNTVTMPTKKYDSDRGFGELIPDLVEFTGKTLFVHDKAAGGRCLHYHQLTEGHTSGLSISDDPAEVDNVTVFAPDFSPVFSRTSVDLRNVVRGRDQAGRISFVSDDASVAAHNADGLYHQATIDFQTTSQADLDVKAAAYLASSKNDYDSRSVAIGPLDEDALALIRVGDLISVDSVVLALTGDYKRIAHMTLKPYGVKPSTRQWTALLELEQPIRRRARVKAVAPPAALAPAPPFDPNQTITFLSPECAASLLWAPGTITGGGVFDWEATDPPRVTLSNVGAAGSVQAGLTGSPWALDTDAYAVSFTVTFNAAWLDGAVIADSISVGTVTNDVSTYGGHIRMVIEEDTRDGFFEVNIGAGPPIVHLITWVPGATYLLSFNRSGTTFTATLNGVGDTDTVDGGDGNAANAFASMDANGSEVVIVALVSSICVVTEAASPVNGQDFTEVVGTGDGTTTSFSTSFPYVPLTLHVFTDGLEEFGIVQTDPTTGDFDFDVAPFSGETITVTYRVAVNLG